MNVGHVMLTSERVKVAPSMSLHEAFRRMDEMASNGLAVVDGERYLGVVSRRDLGSRALASGGGEGATVREVMGLPRMLDYDEPVETAVGLLIEDTSLVFPVAHYGQYAGLVTWDQVRHFVKEVMAVDARNPRIHLALFNAPGQLARVLNVLARAQANVTSLIISEPKVTDLSHVVLKVDPEHAERAKKTLREAGFTLLS